MAKSGLKHIDVGPELTKTEWESEESHELVHGNSFPGSPAERQLYYRDDQHKWYVYNGSSWIEVGGGHDRQHSITSTAGHTSGATSGKILKADANGLPVDTANTDTEVAEAVTRKHDKQHSIVSTGDHTSAATSGKMLKADANGLPVDGSNTDTEVADAVTKKHSQLCEAPDFIKLDGIEAGADVTANHDPKAHKTSHQNGGSDEINVAGLNGELADDQPPKTHATDHAIGGSDAISNKFLPDIVRAANFQMIPTAAGWAEVVTGSGSVGQQPFRNYVNTGATASSTARCYAPAYGFNEGATYQYINWDKELYLIASYARYQANALIEAWIQLAEQNTGVDLTSEGIGLVCKDMALYGESYGTSRAETSLGVTLGNQESHQIVIHHSPGSFVKFYVDGVLKATHSVAANIPAGAGTAGIYLTHSIVSSGAHSGFSTSNMMHGKVWQER